MRVAICLSGQIRHFDRVKLSLCRRILSRLKDYQVDIFAHYPIEPSTYAPDLPFLDCLTEDESNIVFPVASVPHAVESRPWHQGNTLRAFYLQLRSIYLSNELKKRAEAEGGFRYDWVFRLRFDSLYFGHRLERLADLDSKYIFIPSHDNWDGYNDRFAFSCSNNMDIYSMRYIYFREYLETGIALHPEIFLKWVLDRHDVQVRRTCVSLHLLRHLDLWRAEYRPERGDVGSPPRTTTESIFRYLQGTAWSHYSYKLYLAKARFFG